MNDSIKYNRYSKLNPNEIAVTMRSLTARVEERFPGSGLSGVSRELETIAERAESRAINLQKPKILIRACVFVLAASAALVFGKLAFVIKVSDDILSLSQFVQSVGSGLEGGAILTAFALFLWAMEKRTKRAEAIEFLSELRSMAHIIDLHQMRKEHVLPGVEPTEHSPRRDMDELRLSRYLEYCSEMLSIISMIASYYAQELDDEQFLDSVDQVADLTNGMATRILQKKISTLAK